MSPLTYSFALHRAHVPKEPVGGTLDSSPLNLFLTVAWDQSESNSSISSDSSSSGSRRTENRPKTA